MITVEVVTSYYKSFNGKKWEEVYRVVEMWFKEGWHWLRCCAACLDLPFWHRELH